MSRTLLSKKIDELYIEMTLSIKQDLAGVEYVCITCNLWSGARRSYLGITCHWLLEDLSRKNIAIACRRMIGSNTYDKLAEVIQAVMREFGIQNKTNSSLTDRGKNFLKSFRLFGEPLGSGSGEADNNDDEDAEGEEFDAVDISDIIEGQEEQDIRLPPHHKCATHRLSNIATIDTESANYDSIFKRKSRSAHAKCQALLNKQGRSYVATDAIREACGKLFHQPNDTRWNSSYDSLRSIRVAIEKSEDQLDGLMDQLGLPRFTPDDVKFLTEYCQVFKPFASVLDILQRDNDGYIGMLLPLLTKLKYELDAMTPDLDICGPLAEALVAGIDKRFARDLENDNYYIAAFLHPRFKDQWETSEEKRANIWRQIKAELPRETAARANPPCDSRVNNSKDALDQFFPIQPRVLNTVDVLESFKCEECGPLTDLHKYPAIKKLFIKYNTALPSSASVER